MPTHTLWPELAPERAHEILLGVNETNKKLYKTGLELLAPHMGLRTVRVLEMSKRDRHAQWQSLLGHPSFEPLSFNLFTTWLIHAQIPLLCAWLDSLGIKHDGKGCTETFPPCPTESELRQAVDGLLTRFPADVVAVYLRVFNEIEDVQWHELQKLVESEPRLRLTAASPL